MDGLDGHEIEYDVDHTEPEDDEEYVPNSQSSFEGQDPYGELVEIETIITLDEYMEFCFLIDLKKICPRVLAKLKQYKVIRASENYPCVFGLSYEDKEYFGKYSAARQYETEKKSHEVLDPLNCPSIIKMVDAFAIGEGGIIITPMYMRHDHFIVRDFMKSVMKQLLQAIKTCHDRGIAHLDIKPANTVWEFKDPYNCAKFQLYLTDFAFACFDFTEYKNKTITHIPGTPCYFSPERLRGDIPPDPRFCDIFAAGVFFLDLIMYNDYPAFKQGTLEEVLEVIENFDKREGRLLIPSALDLLKKLLEVDYTKRITVNEALEHEFFQDPASYYTVLQYTAAHKLPLEMVNVNTFK